MILFNRNTKKKVAKRIEIPTQHRMANDLLKLMLRSEGMVFDISKGSAQRTVLMSRMADWVHIPLELALDRKYRIRARRRMRTAWIGWHARPVRRGARSGWESPEWLS